MKNLLDEISRRFPEIRERIEADDAEEPYVLMSHLVHWLAEITPEQMMREPAGRIVAFARWCEAQPRGKDASDDLLTILEVGFYEALFDRETTRQLLPKLFPREHIIGNADYYKAWVGEENYEKALLQYGVERQDK